MTKVNMKNFSTEVLVEDRESSIADIALCEKALSEGIFTYRKEKGDVRHRLINNRRIVSKIEKELKVRKHIYFDSSNDPGGNASGEKS